MMNMGTKLSQVELSYDPMEDRIILRLKTQDFAEYRLWITRRYLKMLWPVLQKLLREHQPMQEELDAPLSEDFAIEPKGKDLSPGAVSEAERERVSEAFEKEQSLKQSPLAKQFATEIVTTPLGEKPQLVTQLQVRQEGGTGNYVLCLNSPEGKGFELSLDRPLLLSICKLLSEGLKRTDWDLDYRF